MKQLEITGGAKVGVGLASWPFAKLVVSKSRLDLHVSLLGSFVFAPTDIINIEIVKGFGTSGIRFHHKVETYKKQIEFYTKRSVEDVMKMIENTGFLNNPITQKPMEIVKRQNQGGMPFRLSTVFAVIVFWNSLVIHDVYHFFTGHNQTIPLGIGGKIGTSSIFLCGLLTIVLPNFHKMILKEGRELVEVKTFILFLMFISGMMFILLNIVGYSIAE